MFDFNKSRDFFTAGKARQRLLRLENLEDRAVPAVVGLTTPHDITATAATPTTKSAPTPAVLPATTPASVTAFGTGTGSVGFLADFGTGPTDAAQTLNIPKFDTSLGTLNSVTITATGSTTTHAKIENLGPAATNVQSEVNADILFNVNAGGTILESTPTVTNTATLAAFDNVIGPTSNAFHDFGLTPLAGTFQSTTITDPTALAAYEGSGTVPVAENVSVTSCSCGSGNLMSNVVSTASGNVKVVYNYTPATPTPIPDTIPPVTPPTPDTILPSKDLFIFYL